MGDGSMFSLTERKSMRSTEYLDNHVRRKIVKKYSTLYLMVIPAFLCYFLIRYVPLWGLSLAFVDYKVGKSIFDCEFVGFSQFIKFFNDVDGAMRVFRNTIIINITAVAFIYVVGIILAICMHENRAKHLTRTSQLLALFPYFLSPVIVYSIASIFFAQNNGVINIILRSIGVLDDGISFLGSDITRWVMVFSRVWCQAGYYAILFYSTLTSINMDEFDAAAVDGASRLQRIRYISLPHLKGTVSVLLVVSLGGVMGSSLEEFKLWTNSANYDTMTTFSTFVYNYGLGKLDFSYAAAVDMFNGILSMALVLFANKISKKLSSSSLI